MAKMSDQQRIAGRQWAEDVLLSLDGTSPDYRLGFRRRMKAWLAEQDPPMPRTMRDEEARVFGNLIVEFGKYAGKRVDDVPLEYWDWCLQENEKVRNYVASRRVQAELNNED